MLTDNQVRLLMKLRQSERTIAQAAAKAGMDEKTARKYLKIGKLPSELKKDRTWRTREDPFIDVWSEVEEKLSNNPGLEAKALFEQSLDLYQQFKEAEIPTVLINRRVPGLDVPCVMSDNELGGYLATKHLLEQGHTRIAAGFPPVYSTFKARETGYRRALAEFGVPQVEGLVQYACLDDPEPVKTMVDILLAREDRPTAIFAFTDDYAAKVFERLQELGIRKAFRADSADFFGISDDTLFISEVKHKSFVEVNEEGTEAAAVTSIGMVTSTAAIMPHSPFEMIVDRPFLFLIRQQQSGAILFMGRVTDPGPIE